MDGLADVLELARERYVAKFAQVIGELRASARRIIVEPDMRAADGPLARRAMTSRRIRLDVIAVMHTGVVRTVSIDADGVTEFPRATFTVEDVSVTVWPFAWDNAELWADGAPEQVTAALGEWFDAAFRPARFFAHEEMQAVTHFMSDPIGEGAMTSCTVDLGTAPIAQLNELVTLLGRAGVRRLAIGSPGQRPG